MPLHLAKYKKHITHFDLPESQQDEFIHIFYIYMDSFVGLGFGDDPTQICLEGQAVESALVETTVLGSDGHVDVCQNLTTTFNAAKGKP